MRVHGQHQLLNAPGFASTGAIVADVEDTSRWQPGCDREGNRLTTAYGAEREVVWQLANCDRSITFECEWESAAGRRNTLRKIDAMIAALSAFRAGVVKEQGRYVQRRRAMRSRAER